MVNLRNERRARHGENKLRLLTAYKRSCIVPAMNMLEVIVNGAETPARHDPPPAVPHFAGTAPCPFCGSDPPLATQLHGRFIVGCESDDCHVNPQVSGQSLGEAWARWNKRQEKRGS